MGRSVCGEIEIRLRIRLVEELCWGSLLPAGSAGIAVERSVHLRIEIGQQKWYGVQKLRSPRASIRRGIFWRDLIVRLIGPMVGRQKWKLCFASYIDWNCCIVTTSAAPSSYISVCRRRWCVKLVWIETRIREGDEFRDYLQWVIV